ncbi:MAG: hypothetical protein KTR30_15950 [Saprospiraceae bacterium]|nr:hypothetical protein [Saprospiraceae bacterium]
MTSLNHVTPQVVNLCSRQERAYSSILSLIPKSPVLALVSEGSYGRSTVLRKLAAQLPAKYLDLGDLFDDIKQVDPLQLEEAVLACFERSFAEQDTVIFDDYYAVQEQLVENCQNTARPSILSFALSNICIRLERARP